MDKETRRHPVTHSQLAERTAFAMRQQDIIDLDGKHVLITGGTGSFGRAFVDLVDRNVFRTSKVGSFFARRAQTVGDEGTLERALSPILHWGCSRC